MMFLIAPAHGHNGLDCDVDDNCGNGRILIHGRGLIHSYDHYCNCIHSYSMEIASNVGAALVGRCQ